MPGAGDPMHAAPQVATEEAFAFEVGDDTSIGLLHRPAPDTMSSTAVLVVVGGPQYRAGSHRQFLLLARSLAACGTPVMRFDVRGMGDSSGAQRTFEKLSDDITAAVDQLQRRVPQLERVVLWGLCDGASASLLYMDERRDRRIGGLCLLNPWVRSTASLARTHVKHYYLQRLMQREFWIKLLAGRVARTALTGLLANLRVAGARPSTGASDETRAEYQTRMARAWFEFEGPLLLVLSGNDFTAREFEEYVDTDPAWRGALSRERLSIHRVERADHTFSRIADARALEARVIEWIKRDVAVGVLPSADAPGTVRRQDPLQWT